MSDAPELVYLEADDEVTGVVRRIRASIAPRVIVVAPGRSRATSSGTALRLLRRAAEAAEREISVVGDPLTRSLAAEAGIAAYASVEDARTADGAPPGSQPTAQQAPIRIMRGSEAIDSVPTIAGASTALSAIPAADVETRAVPVVRAPSRRRPHVAWAILGAAVATLATGAVLAIAVLPAATIRIVPRTTAIGPVAYDIAIPDAEHTTGTVDARATVTATGTYPISEPAAGTVVLFNWTFQPVFVPAGTFVAAGEQAFATQADVVVPRGHLTIDGRIAAGDTSVAVLAAAPGPAGNVAAHAIDTVVNESIDDQLGGVPENPERRVDNGEPTAGGVEDTGSVITQADIDLAVADLTDALATAAADAVSADGDLVFADVAEAPQPVIEGLDGLVGTRDQATAELSGTLAYDRLSAPADEVRQRALERFASEAAQLVPDGDQLLSDATRVELGTPSRDGERLVVPVTVRAQAAATIDREAVIELASGRSKADAEANLADIGQATVDLWPGWVTAVPGITWRIEVVPAGPSPSPGSS